MEPGPRTAVLAASPGELLNPAWSPSGRGWLYQDAEMRLNLPEEATGAHSLETVGGASLSFRPVSVGGDRPPAASRGDLEPGLPGEVSYRAVRDGVDERFRITPHGLKHDLVLLGRPAGDPAGSLVFTWRMELSPGLRPEVGGVVVVERADTREAILIRGEGDDLPFLIRPPLIEAQPPSGGHHPVTTTGTWRLRRDGEGWRLELHAPMSWLLDPDLSYPVRVDPTVDVQPQADSHTGYVTWDGTTTYQRIDGTIVSGTLTQIQTFWDDVNGFARFDTSAIPDGATIQSVLLQVWMNNHDNPNDSAVPLPMQVHDLPLDPVVAGNQQVFDAINAGAIYVNTTVPRTGPLFCVNSYALFEYSLPALALTNMEALLTQDRFSLGFTSQIVTDPFFDHIDYVGYPEEVTGECGFERFPGTRINLVVIYEDPNQPPVCDPGGPYLQECEGATTSVAIDGSASYDPDGDPIQARWTTDCPGGALSDPSALRTTLTLDSAGACVTACSVFLGLSDGTDTSACQAAVTVEDTTPPDLTVPEPTLLECNSPGGVLLDDPQIQDWLGLATATDLCSNGAVLGNDAPPLFPAGCPPGMPTPVTFTATDACGNQASETSEVTVVDSTPPVIEEVGFDGICLWSPNHKYFCIEDVPGMVTATDVCDPDPPASGVSECLSSQPENDIGDGHTFEDCVVADSGAGVCLRAERQGTRPEGRDYGVVVYAADRCDNTSEVTAGVHVPHDQSPSRKECLRANAGKDLEDR